MPEVAIEAIELAKKKLDGKYFPPIRKPKGQSFPVGRKKLEPIS
jgi:hypothetical protein